MNKLITIGREFGSGGRELGRRLAEELGYDYFDKEIITQIAQHTELSEDYVRQIVEHRPRALFPISTGHSLDFAPDYQLHQMNEIYRAQAEIIRDLAESTNCVIIGRCADYILRDAKPFRLFVYADPQSRVRRCMERFPEDGKHLSESEMRRRINAVDRDRARYYEDFTGHRWGDPSYYDLCINTTNLDLKTFVPSLAKLFL